jgi:hypothetical protein
MRVLLVIPALVVALSLAILKALAVDELQGRMKRHISESVEATIASLPPELAAEWADEWRAEYAAASAMPLTAARLVRGLRHSACELIEEGACSGAGADADSPRADRAPGHAPQRTRRAWPWRKRENNRHRGLPRDRLALLSSSSMAVSWRAPSSATTPRSPGPDAWDSPPPSPPSPSASPPPASAT